jgi:hypothetical protein
MLYRGSISSFKKRDGKRDEFEMALFSAMESGIEGTLKDKYISIHFLI